MRERDQKAIECRRTRLYGTSSSSCPLAGTGRRLVVMGCVASPATLPAGCCWEELLGRLSSYSPARRPSIHADRYGSERKRLPTQMRPTPKMGKKHNAKHMHRGDLPSKLAKTFNPPSPPPCPPPSPSPKSPALPPCAAISSSSSSSSILTNLPFTLSRLSARLFLQV